MAGAVDPAQFMEIKKSLEILHGNIDQLFLLVMGSIIFCEYLRPFFPQYSFFRWILCMAVEP